MNPERGSQCIKRPKAGRRWVLPIAIGGLALMPLVSAAQDGRRVRLSLDGQWQVEDSVGADEFPAAYTHSVPVPGLTHSATPRFPDVDLYQTGQLLSNLVRQGRFSKADYDHLADPRGISGQKRNYFWYRRTFHAPQREAVALLRVGKAQFGAVVYINGVRIGELPPFSAWARRRLPI